MTGDDDDEVPDFNEALMDLAAQVFDTEIVRDALASAMLELAREESNLDAAWSDLEAREMLLAEERARLDAGLNKLGLTLISQSPQLPANDANNEN